LLLNVHIDFNRNNTKYAIIIPLFAIFFLLGTIFISESEGRGEKGKEHLIIRVTITVGIFAFLFAFVPIVNQMKPLTTLNNTPTIADFLITIIILATITFTMSSVISDSAIKKYNVSAPWIDVVAFLVIVIITLAYVSVYPPNIRLWLIPVILLTLFGLGYGLLFRIPRLLKLFSSGSIQESKNNEHSWYIG
jgi:hypothetical protein